MNFEQITTNGNLQVSMSGCLCHRKGNEFWANHNAGDDGKDFTDVVFVTAKVMNFEQITTAHDETAKRMGCLCHRKGNEFWANHNDNQRKSLEN